MPTYSMRNKETNEVFEASMKIAERDQYLKDNPHLEQIFTTFPGVVDSVRIGVRKSDDNFKDVLRNVKSHHKHNTIDV